MVSGPVGHNGGVQVLSILVGIHAGYLVWSYWWCSGFKYLLTPSIRPDQVTCKNTYLTLSSHIGGGCGQLVENFTFWAHGCLLDKDVL